jgi:hypothetical protein
MISLKIRCLLVGIFCVVLVPTQATTDGLLWETHIAAGS